MSYNIFGDKSAATEVILVGSNQIKDKEITLARIAETTQRCPNFFDWDWCEGNCVMYLFCDSIEKVQDVSSLQNNGIGAKLREAVSKFRGTFKRLINVLKKRLEGIWWRE